MRSHKTIAAQSSLTPPGPPPGRPSPSRKKPDRPPQRKKRKLLRRSILALFLLFMLSGGIFGYKVIATGNKISTTDRSMLGQITDLLFGQDKVLLGENEDRINLMLIAIGGAGHSGQDLADTIMIASIRPSDNQVALLSIPRDLYVQVPGEEYYSKINSVHAYGESQNKGQGPEILKETVEDVTGLPIHYYARVDFTAFKEIVNAVGGVDVTIENSFHDYWHKIDFPAGTEHMDGERALAYVRARYVEGPEGGDFKRAERQQQILLALRQKVFSINTAFDFTGVNSILNSMSDNIRTDLELWEMKRFYEIARQTGTEKFHSVVLTSGPAGPLVGTTEILGGVPASVLMTKTGNFSEIHKIAAEIFSAENNLPPSPGAVKEEPVPSPESEPSKEPAKEIVIEIRNGTNITGLAKKTSDSLKDEGYIVSAIGNAISRERTETTVYYLSAGAQSKAEEVAHKLSAQTDSGLPSGEPASEADILVILGADAE